jgi:hypothetical protein
VGDLGECLGEPQGCSAPIEEVSSAPKANVSADPVDEEKILNDGKTADTGWAGFSVSGMGKSNLIFGELPSESTEEELPEARPPDSSLRESFGIGVVLFLFGLGTTGIGAEVAVVFSRSK